MTPKFIHEVPYPLDKFLQSALAAKLERRGFVVQAEESSFATVHAEFEDDGTLHNALRVHVFVGLQIRISRKRGWFGRLELLQLVNIGYDAELNEHHGASGIGYVVERCVDGMIGSAFERCHQSIGQAVVTLHQTFDWLEKNL